jgi:trk system potassium uptake protein
MHPKSIFFILSKMLIYFYFIIFIPLLYAIFDKQSSIFPFLATAMISLFLGLFLQIITKNTDEVSIRDGFIIVTLGWLVYSILGSIPYLYSGTLGNFADAFFETISGFTTTGASVISEIEATPKAILLWRSITQYIGGLGIIVLTITILPEIGLGAVRLFNSEMPGPTKERIFPKIKDTAKTLWLIYVSLTVLLAFLLYFSGMNIFDSLNHALTTMSTGGFSTKNLSLISFNNPLIEWIILIFMFIAGINLTLHLNFIRTKRLSYFRHSEFKLYLTIVLVAWLLVFFNINSYNKNILDNIRISGFNVISILTTTGFVSTDTELWSYFGQFLLLILMFIGAMAGSTSGGIKISRVMVMLKKLFKELTKILHPKMVYKIKISKHPVDEEIIKNISLFFFLYLTIFIFSSLLLTSFNIDILTSISAVSACLSNIGPGLGEVGALDNFAHLPNIVKYVLSFLMLAGRLELYTILVIFMPAFWKR